VSKAYYKDVVHEDDGAQASEEILCCLLDLRLLLLHVFLTLSRQQDLRMPWA